MKFGYADPPYLGRCSYYGHNHNPDGGRRFDGLCWNDIETHAALINYLVDNYRDGFVLSLSAPSLREIWPLCPATARCGAWVKPFASFKPGVNPGYCWEPFIFVGGRKLGRETSTIRDYVSANILLQKGVVGAKPPAVCEWVMDFMGFDASQDTFDDLFTGAGSFTRARDERIARSAA